MRRLPLAVLFVFVSLTLWAGAHSLPRAHGQAVLPSSSVAFVTLPPLDVARLLAEDKANAGLAIPYRIGIPRSIAATLRDGTIEALRDGGTLWRLAVTSPGAPWMSVEMDGLTPMPGLEVRFHNLPGGFVAGPLTGTDLNASGILASPMVPGDTLIVEVYLPAGAGVMPVFTVGSAVTGYKALGPDRGAGSCNIDINCPEGADWQDDKRAVASIVFGGYVCTGTLLNNAAGDCRNYFLTANHCIHNDSTAQSTVFYWNYEWSGCGDGDFLFSDWQSGSTLRAQNPKSDFTLLELNTPPDLAFHLYYAGWNANPDPADGAVGIHHPSGDVKKISIEYDPLVSSFAYKVDAWRVPSWDLGVTEGGSSGSGLWDMNHRIVGQLFGGESQCGNPASWMHDDYGKFSSSWSGGTSASTRLKEWLDPNATGVLSIAGKDSATCGSSTSTHTRPVGRPQ